MNVLFPLLAVVVLLIIAIAGVGSANMDLLFGVIIPYIAVVTFVCGIVYRVIRWARSPVPFHIPTTCGQQKSLPWIKANNFESPHNTLGVIGRMALEVFLFRSLFRNTKMELKGQKLVYGEEKLLWAAGLAFHWSFLVIVLRHLRFFTEPIPFFVPIIQKVDGFFDLSVPTLYMSSIGILLAVTYLFFRRVVMPSVRYISLPADYFPLFLKKR